MSTYYPQEPGKNTGNQAGQPPVDPYSINPAINPNVPPPPYGPPSQPYGPPSQPQGPSSQPYGPPSQPYGPPSQPYGPYGPPSQPGGPQPSQPYGAVQPGPVTPLPSPQYQQYPAAGQIPYPPTPASYGPPPTPPAKSNGRVLIIALVALVILASIGAIAVPYAKAQIDHANATATASTHATTVAHDATATVVTQHAQATGTAQAIAEATAAVVKANPNPYPPQTGTLVVMEKTPQIDLVGHCLSTNGTVHLIEPQQNATAYCWGGDSHENFAYDIQMTITKGDCGGLVFREDGTESRKEYVFDVCQDGYYEADLDQGAAQQFKLLKSGQTTPGLHTGLNQMNLIGVVAQGPNFSLYVNKQLVTTFTDGTYGSGQLGVNAWNIGHDTDVTFSNQRVWKL
jgi:type II secretory pathway pseudopilin PulG